ncbi:MAG: carbohydrate ABC transporter permease [Caldilineaceae bacterium SB0670_bin_27]|uniref:Carbohydrate ABC transporter permease n=1 Tax=Caldilineaceae bacterium SB0664_bin_27 TaxID=2605260 RepID=A0A6B0YN64_9CHLR|nr:carbohydrate ABC transporter permease [Caldilineaceae bacterium]MDE0339776.1 carbohydrate ABC transporter permease [Caldilineaceae bacterium]MXY92370.1 carbohydrate ABC transporter permease [Caldilineaceae bacterium SB0664_bin_27]MYJ76646.1 carbohydrate ABC transporter permease [Caldilineaceae bacterium SB0670_bin_27]
MTRFKFNGDWRKTIRVLPQAVIVYVLLAALVILMLGPYLYIFSSSFKETYTLISIPPQLIPEEFVWDNYSYILTELPFSLWFFNTILVALLVTVGTVLIDALAAYAFAKKQFWGRDFLFGLMLATIMIPGALLLIPAFLITNWLGLLNSYGGLIIPGLANVLGVFLLRQFMQTIPEELEHAARIDGCSDFGVFWRIILPLSAPALATLSIVVFTSQWNNLVWPLVVLNDKDLYTLPLGLALLRSEFQVNYGITSASAFLSVVPLVIVFLFLQRYFLEGLTVGAVKG